MHLKNEIHRRNSQLLKAERKQSLPLRLQAHERIALFLEPSIPNQLLHRMATDDGIPESQDLRQALLKKTLKTPPPSAISLSVLKIEVLQLL